MVRSKASKAATPVFVFLDENVSCARFEKLKSAKVSPKYKLRIIPFPLVMDSLGIFDFQVVLLLKKMITSRFYPIRRILHQIPRPHFIFLTKDMTFLKDAENGFISWRGDKRRKRQYKDIRFHYDPVSPENDSIAVYINNDHVVNITIRYIKGGNNDNQEIILDKMIKTLEKLFL